MTTHSKSPGNTCHSYLLSRRSWFQVMGAAALLGQAARAAESGLQAKARKNLKLATFTGVYSSLPLKEAAQRIKANGFLGVVQEYNFADVRFDPLAPDWPKAEKIQAAFAEQGLQTVGLYGYYNVVDPDAARRQRGQARMQFLLENWKRLGSPVVATETGTLNAKSEWLEAPENSTEKGYQVCCDAFKMLIRSAEKTGAVVAVEPYWRNIIDSPERTARLFRDVRSPALKLIMDPCNYYRKADLPRMRPILEDIFKRVGKQTILAHAKDVVASPEGTDLPASGRGVLDYPLYLRLLAQLNREIYLAIEHVTMEDIPRARDYVLQQFNKL